MTTHVIEWVAGGRAFEVSSRTPTPRAQEQALLVKSHLIKSELSGCRDLPDIAVKAMLADLQPVIFVRMMNVLIADVLCQVDPSLKAMTPSEIQAKLSTDEYEALAFDLLPKPSRRGGEKGDEVVDPLTTANR